ncbi:MAG: hypothetical protein SGI77_26255 [Pirellulaceae bacterium]|nr:hypothetical protein [Pirellulaceae bacterium]
MANQASRQEPLLDADWLLGPPDVPKAWWRRFLMRSVGALAIVATGVSLWPTLSKAWLQQQLVEQYRSNESVDARNAAMISLAEMLPHSLTDVIAGLSKSNADEAHLAYEALDYYVGQVIALPIEHRRASFAELIYVLEEPMSGIPLDSHPLIDALVSRVSVAQQADQHPGSVLTIAACQRILDRTRSKASKTIVARAKLSDGPDYVEPKPAGTIVASLSDKSTFDAPSQSSAASVDQVAAMMQPSSQAIRRSLKVQDDSEPEPSNLDRRVFSDSTVASRPLRQRLHQANRFIPVTGMASMTIQSNTDPSPRNASEYAEDTLADAPFATTASTARIVAIEEEVVGISRRNTDDLIRLLRSTQPRVVSAAFHELQRTRLSRKELDLAVELAQGTKDQRLLVMERLIKDADLNPLPWLVWMGSEAERDVRMKAVSMLGSINNEDARLKLRTILQREPDSEISRHIQHVLLASGSNSPHKY